MIRKEFNYKVAVSNLRSCSRGSCISIDFHNLAKTAVEAGFTEMDTTQKAREAFISDIISVLNDSKTKRIAHKELCSAICVIGYHVGNLCVKPSWAHVQSRCIVIGRLGYVFKSSVDLRRQDCAEFVACGERGKAKKIHTEFDADFCFY